MSGVPEPGLAGPPLPLSAPPPELARPPPPFSAPPPALALPVNITPALTEAGPARGAWDGARPADPQYPFSSGAPEEVAGAPEWVPWVVLAVLVLAALLSLSAAFCALGARCCGAGRSRARRREQPPPNFDAAVHVA